MTQSTEDMMERAAGAQHGKLNLPWLGRAFDLSTEEGQALLATPQGVGVAYMVKDHNDVLRRKTPSLVSSPSSIQRNLAARVVR